MTQLPCIHRYFQGSEVAVSTYSSMHHFVQCACVRVFVSLIISPLLCVFFGFNMEDMIKCWFSSY